MIPLFYSNYERIGRGVRPERLELSPAAGNHLVDPPVRVPGASGLPKCDNLSPFLCLTPAEALNMLRNLFKPDSSMGELHPSNSFNVRTREP